MPEALPLPPPTTVSAEPPFLQVQTATVHVQLQWCDGIYIGTQCEAMEGLVHAEQGEGRISTIGESLCHHLERQTRL